MSTALASILLHLSGRTGDLTVAHHRGRWSCTVNLDYRHAVHGTGNTPAEAMADAQKQLGVAGHG